MRFSGVSAIAIWNAATRNLTGIGSGALIPQSSINTSLANGVTANLLPGAGKFRDVVVLGVAAANVTWNLGLSDGATIRIGVTGASGAAVMSVLKGLSTFGPAISNSGTVSGNYSMAGTDWVQ